MSELEIKTEEDWDLIITPRKKWWDLQLRDVWHYRDTYVPQFEHDDWGMSAVQYLICGIKISRCGCDCY